LRPLNPTLFNKTNNIVDLNAHMIQSKVFLNTLLDELFEKERKIVCFLCC
jgi:hypothetical protein